MVGLKKVSGNDSNCFQIRLKSSFINLLDFECDSADKNRNSNFGLPNRTWDIIVTCDILLLINVNKRTIRNSYSGKESSRDHRHHSRPHSFDSTYPVLAHIYQKKKIVEMQEKLQESKEHGSFTPVLLIKLKLCATVNIQADSSSEVVFIIRLACMRFNSVTNYITWTNNGR